MSKEIPRLRRFTSLTVALDMLVERRVTLVDYAKWPDVNDRIGMKVYKDTLHYGFLGAMCLTMAKETFHHWQVFAGDSAGVCVFFRRNPFIAMFDGNPNVIHGPAEYVELPRIASVDASDIHLLPFLKRRGFIDELEYRIIGFSPDEEPAIHVALDPRAVSKITFSPFVHPALVASAKKVITGLAGWEDLRVRHSRLTDSQTWQRAIANYPNRHGTVYGPWIDILDDDPEDD